MRAIGTPLSICLSYHSPNEYRFKPIYFHWRDPQIDEGYPVFFILTFLFIVGCNNSNSSDDEILSFVLKYSDLNETTVKLKDWPDTNEDEEQLSDPIYFVVVEKDQIVKVMR